VRGELAQIFLAFRPTLIVVPDARDEHPDHCATHALAHAALEAAYVRGLHPVEILHYVIHYHQWPVGSASQPFASDSWRALRLTRDEREGKSRAIEAFHSQLTVMAAFLRAFDRTVEMFTQGDPVPMAPCWCRGENILRAKDAPDTATHAPDAAPQEKMKRP
jgi:LmbE family N-acetylglucosaminyl deacetylase